MSLHFERMQADFQKSISEAISGMKDPRIPPMTSVVRSDLTKDLRHAKVYISVLEDDSDKQEQVISVLNKASAMLMHEINGKMKMRRIPQLHFVLDQGIAYSAHINSLLKQINSSKSEQEEVSEPVDDNDE